VALESFFDGRTECDEAFDLRLAVGRLDVEMHRRFRSRLEIDFLEAELEMWSVEDNAGIAVARVAECSQPGDLVVVIPPNRILLQGSSPEAGQRRWCLTVEHDLLQPGHAVSLARRERRDGGSRGRGGRMCFDEWITRP
jgi:hypothetical protein